MYSYTSYQCAFQTLLPKTHVFLACYPYTTNTSEAIGVLQSLIDVIGRMGHLCRPIRSLWRLPRGLPVSSRVSNQLYVPLHRAAVHFRGFYPKTMAFLACYLHVGNTSEAIRVLQTFVDGGGPDGASSSTNEFALAATSLLVRFHRESKVRGMFLCNV